ncbi:hypothetical protein ACTJKO_07760 [Curtobacterium sp. 22159]|uniref:hypothetical protein n=1 Tax=Curtobacterium sp. 22159 TaxID=3453882 RepID=UPI003F85FBCB
MSRDPGKDDRLFLQLALDFDDNPKIRPLSDKAFRTLVQLLLYSAKAGTDGRIDAALFRTFGTPKARNELLSNHPTRPSVMERDGAFWLHHFERHNRTVAEIESLSKKRAAAGSKGGKAKASANQAGKQTPPQSGSRVPPRSPDPQITDDRSDQDSSSSVQLVDAGEDWTDDELNAQAIRSFGYLELEDFPRVRSEIAKATGRIPTSLQVTQIAQTILARGGAKRSPTGYVLASIRADWAEWQQWLDNGVAS